MLNQQHLVKEILVGRKHRCSVGVGIMTLVALQSFVLETGYSFNMNVICIEHKKERKLSSFMIIKRHPVEVHCQLKKERD